MLPIPTIATIENVSPKLSFQPFKEVEHFRISTITIILSIAFCLASQAQPAIPVATVLPQMHYRIMEPWHGSNQWVTICFSLPSGCRLSPSYNGANGIQRWGIASGTNCTDGWFGTDTNVYQSTNWIQSTCCPGPVFVPDIVQAIVCGGRDLIRITNGVCSGWPLMLFRSYTETNGDTIVTASTNGTDWQRYTDIPGPATITVTNNEQTP